MIKPHCCKSRYIRMFVCLEGRNPSKRERRRMPFNSLQYELACRIEEEEGPVVFLGRMLSHNSVTPVPIKSHVLDFITQDRKPLKYNPLC